MKATPPLKILGSARDLPAAVWDDLAEPGDLFVSARWLRVAEDTSGVPMWYLLYGLPGELRGGLPAALVPRSAPWLLGRPDTLLQHCIELGEPAAQQCRAALPTDLARALMPALVCGGRHLGRTRALTRGEDEAASTDLVAAAERLMRDQGARCIAFLYVDEREAVLRRVLTRRGYTCFPSATDTWLPVPDDGFDGYLAARSGHRRQRILAERRRIAAGGAHVQMEPLSSDLIPALARMDTALLVKYGAAATASQSAAVLERVLAEFGDDALACTARIHGTLCGFALVLRRGDHWYAYRSGFDYSLKGDLPLYFEVVFYHPIEAARAAGAQIIHYGTGSTEAKLSRGCVSAAQYAFFLRAEPS